MSTRADNEILELRPYYRKWKGRIEKRLRDFRRIYRNGSEEEIFEELAFCLMTPQSKARSCDLTVRDLTCKGLLLKGDCHCLSKQMNRVRFRNNKARYIVEARDLFKVGGKLHIKERLAGFPDPMNAREWLVDKVKGFGYKEASHFLRNLGFGKDLAILDRHILKNLKLYRAISQVPNHISKAKYLEIEKKMRKFSKDIRIPMDHLDLLFWSKETGEIFK